MPGTHQHRTPGRVRQRADGEGRVGRRIEEAYDPRIVLQRVADGDTLGSKRGHCKSKEQQTSDERPHQAFPNLRTLRTSAHVSPFSRVNSTRSLRSTTPPLPTTSRTTAYPIPNSRPRISAVKVFRNK